MKKTMMLRHRQMCRHDCARRPWLMCGWVSQSVRLTRRVQESFRRENLSSQINKSSPGRVQCTWRKQHEHVQNLAQHWKIKHLK
jgi:hypothetical protein